MNEVIREFLLETQENLAQLDLDLVTLEREPTERETLSRVFRTMHTVKGSAGFLGLPKLQAVAHAAETLLSRLRAGDLVFQPDIASALLAVVDAVRKMLASIEAANDEGPGDYSGLIRALEQLTHAGSAALPAMQALPMPDASPAPASIAPAPVLSPPEADPNEPIVESVVRAEVEQRTAVADTSIRVDVGLLDKLMTLVGELVLARNQIVQYSAAHEDNTFLGTVQRLNLLTTELQAGVMKTRMQPIGTVWNKFPRLVRDVALACGKEVRIELDGKETELDRTIIEAIRDPLTHLVRNAVDHGIEPSAVRRAAGKPEEGRLLLHAFHEGGKVIIELSDDGAGIDPGRVRDKAVLAKLVTPEAAARLSERELVNLIFLPGFTTTDRVTQFSGRGVGMDVVRTNIEKIGGTVDVDSGLGRGTTVKMKIPLTLAIIPALTITSGGDRYAIPQVSLLELVRLEGGQAQRGIEQIHGAPVYRLRGNLLPLVYLHRELQVESTRPAGGEVNIVVLQADDRHFGLVVDDIHDTEEIVVKPLQKQVKGIAAFAGATIMGDGTVALILDVLGLAQHARVVSAVRERALAEKAAPTEAAVERQSVLLFAAHDGGQMAIPLDMVARLEEFPHTALERLGTRQVVQYRGEILPLLNVTRALRPRRSRNGAAHGHTNGKGPTNLSVPQEGDSGDKVQVVVYAGHGQRVGLVVGRVLDIVEVPVAARAAVTRAGVLFTAVALGRVTEILDVEGIIRASDPRFFERTSPALAEV